MKIIINYFLLIVVIVVTDLFINFYRDSLINNQKETLVKEAKTHYLSLVNMRHWNAQYGGVYVKPKEGMKPNPYLENNTLKVSDELTLIRINPAWMTRQLSEQLENNDFSFHISSLKLKNPHNKADKFETEALEYFEKTKATEYFKFQENKFKYMGPLIVQEECLLCHQDQGYKVGDIRGGISVTLNANHFLEQISNIEWISILGKIIIMTFSIIIALLIHKQLTNNKRLEEEVKIQTKEISQQNIYHRNLLEASIDPLVTISSDGKITGLNKATVEAIGISRDELIGSDFSSYFINRDDAKKGYEKALEEGKVLDYPLQLKNKDGKTIDVLYNATTYNDENGNIAGVFAAARDVTELNKLRTKTEEMAKLKTMSVLLENISHHWRQPLSVVSTLATTMQFKNEMNMLSSEDVEKMSTTINHNVQSLSKTIDDFKLLFTRDSIKKEVDIEQLITKVLNDYSSYLSSNKIEVIKNIEKVHLLVYENEFMQIISNILNNIKEHTIDNKVIFVDFHKVENSYLLEIKDSGGGVDDTIINKLFEAYFTTKHQSVGKGLGLYIAYQLVKEQFNGMMVAENCSFEYNGKQYKGLKISIKFSLDAI